MSEQRIQEVHTTNSPLYLAGQTAQYTNANGAYNNGLPYTNGAVY